MKFSTKRCLTFMRDCRRTSLPHIFGSYRLALPDITCTKSNVAIAHDESRRADTELLVGNLVSVTKFQIKGLEVDLPGLLRMLERLLRR